MPMRRRTLRVVATLGGFPLVLGELLIEQFAKMSDWQKGTSLVCPKCGDKPKFKGGYKCEGCGSDYGHFSYLKRVDAEGSEIVKPRLAENKEKVSAQLYRMSMTEFSDKYADATLGELGVVVKDQNSAMNLMKLVVAVERLGQVVIVKFNDTYEQRIALLSISLSNRVILKEIIPMNLLESEETLRVDMNKISDKDILEAQALLTMIPTATEEVLMVSDYRTLGRVEAKTAETPKVQELSEILAKVSASP